MREPGHRLRLLIAPDSFKGSLTSVEVARAIATGWLRARPGDSVRLAPLADGGEGTLVAIGAAGGWSRREAEAHDPLGRPVRAGWLAREDGAGAFVEMATASGLSLVRPSELDPIAATTRGTGDVLRAVLDAGIRDIALGIGGSATTDGGAGLLGALGADVSDDLSAVSLAGLDPRLGEVRLRIACDVTNPLLGPRGAAAVYGPQKGLRPEDHARLDHECARLGLMLCAHCRQPDSLMDLPGAGAAGGISFGLMAATGARLLPGFDLVAAWLDLENKLAAADLVITGEGRFDDSSLQGKGPGAVAARALALGKTVHVFAGRASVAQPPVGLALHSITPEGVPLEQALPQAPHFLAAAVRAAW